MLTAYRMRSLIMSLVLQIRPFSVIKTLAHTPGTYRFMLRLLFWRSV